MTNDHDYEMRRKRKYIKIPTNNEVEKGRKERRKEGSYGNKWKDRHMKSNK